MTKKPGRCKDFEYQFNIQGKPPKQMSSRPIPFALRKQVREQIQEMVADGILDESFSDYVNPLTIVPKENKSPRICLDARNINGVMVADRAKTPPMRELLQRFHGSNYITSLDLSSAFLQIPLESSSRKWTAFNFENRVLQFTRIPYGFKNSLSAFIRAQVLGDGLDNLVVTYMDDIVLCASYSKTTGAIEAVYDRSMLVKNPK
jgi:hypothetical protein